MVGIIPLILLKHALFEEKDFGKSRVLIFLSCRNHSILNCHTRDIRTTTFTARNDVPDRLDMLTSISMIVFW